MTLLVATRRRSGVYTPPADTTPYAMPTAAPWNAPTYAITPTPDGTGSAVHPSVVDMGAGGWNGYRYWMAVTPYYNSGVSLENPCILGSHDGYTWHVPAGLTNPIFGPPGAADGYGYYSDTEVVWDQDGGRMVTYWRHAAGGEDEIIYATTSTDGATWSPKIQQVAVIGQTDAALSPSIVRIAAGSWAMFTVDYDTVSIQRRTASSPLGPWSAPTASAPSVTGLWHVGVQNVGGTLYAILNSRSPWSYLPATSADAGLTWTVGASMMSNTTGWDNASLYRAQFQPHENGTHFRVWYSSDSTTVSWRIGYTQLPRSLWPT